MKKWIAILLTLALALSLCGCGSAAQKPALSDTGAMTAVPWGTPMSEVEKMIPGGQLLADEDTSSYHVDVSAWEGLTESGDSRLNIISYDKETPDCIQVIVHDNPGDEADLFDTLRELYTQRFGEPRTPTKTRLIWNTQESTIEMKFFDKEGSIVELLLEPAAQTEAE